MNKVTPIKSIRAKCLDCSNFQPSEVKQCPVAECPLFPYRLGKNPKRIGIGFKKGSNLSEKPGWVLFSLLKRLEGVEGH